MNMDPPEHRYNGARSLVMLHEHQLRLFVQTWKRAQAESLGLPVTKDPSYASREALLLHVLGAARGYMVWICEVLDLADPQIDKPPAAEAVGANVDEYVKHLAGKWATPLVGVDEVRFEDTEHKSRWGVLYCVDAMLEHAVMHPIRHEHQLRVLMGEAPTDDR
jgi:hypothetical protein